MKLSAADFVIHTHLQDSVDDGHPLQWETVYCETCGEMVHCRNECMLAWVEPLEHSHRWCIDCFATNNLTYVDLIETERAAVADTGNEDET